MSRKKWVNYVVGKNARTQGLIAVAAFKLMEASDGRSNLAHVLFAL